MHIADLLKKCPLIAVLRDITPTEVIPIAETLITTGFACIEIPINAPDAATSIHLLTRTFAAHALIGAGNIIEPEQIITAAQAGAKVIISPHSDPTIIATAKEIGLLCIPGFSTPTEAFTAIKAGADALKLFPTPIPTTVKALAAVLPQHIPIFPAGGITPSAMVHYLHAGASGFSIGTHLYQAGDTPALVKQNAQIFYDTIRSLC